jgi:hypothetical protein
MSPGYPIFTVSTINLGASYAGQTVKVRLRIGADQAAAGAGWDVDSIAFTGITNTPFPSLIADRAICINRPPIANAGPDLVVDERTVVTLSAAASTDVDNDPLTARWVQVSGPAITVTNGTFTAPEVTSDTTLSLQLIVNDGTVDSAADTLDVTVRQVNRAPVADAGPAQSVDEGTLATLTGSGSDPDSDALTFAWTRLAGPMVTLADAASANPSFTAPLVSTDVPIVFELVVSDGTAMSAVSSVMVIVHNVNVAPIVTVSIPPTADERSTVTLMATASDPDGDTLGYQWRQTSGPAVTLLTPTAASASFIAPEVTVSTPLGFEVTVSDATLTANASGVVNVVNVNRPPIAVINGASREVKAGEVVTLDASGSSDPDGEAISFAWSQPGGDAVALSATDTAVATFTMPKTGALTFRVTVSDPQGATGEAEVTLTASATAPKGCGCTSSAGLFLPLLALIALRRRRPLRSGASARTS